MAKSTSLEDAIEIRRLYKTGQYSHGDLSRMFHRHVMTIGRICRGETIQSRVGGNTKGYSEADFLRSLQRIQDTTGGEALTELVEPILAAAGPTLQDKVFADLDALLADAQGYKCEFCGALEDAFHADSCEGFSSDIVVRKY